MAHTTDSSVKAQTRCTFVTAPELATTLFSESLSVRTLISRSVARGEQIRWSRSMRRGSKSATTPSASLAAPTRPTYRFMWTRPARFRPPYRFLQDFPPPSMSDLCQIYVSIAATATTPLHGTLVRDRSMMFLLEPASYPSVALSSDEVARGSILTITGDLWRPGDVVSVESCLGAPEPDKHGIMQGGPYLASGGSPALFAKITVGADRGFVAKAQMSRRAHLGPRESASTPTTRLSGGTM
jgi:hypothetical protein